MNSPLDRLRQATKQANQTDETRELYARYIASRREQGWNDADVQEYAQNISVLMGKDDAKALDLFPAGLYSTAAEAREGAIQYWREA